VTHGTREIQLKSVRELLSVFPRFRRPAQGRQDTERALGATAAPDSELARQVANPLVLRGLMGANLLAEDDHLASARSKQSHDTPKRRGLPGSVRPQVAKDLAAGDRKRDVFDPSVGSVVLG
jgi:hypothetical protein